jgi:hypothetical protein
MDGDGCTGILVTHDDGWVECLDPDCTDADALRHQWRLACADVDTASCGACADPLPDRRRHAA